jgi:hypothetical protein
MTLLIPALTMEHSAPDSGAFPIGSNDPPW